MGNLVDIASDICDIDGDHPAKGFPTANTTLPCGAGTAQHVGNTRGDETTSAKRPSVPRDRFHGLEIPVIIEGEIAFWLVHSVLVPIFAEPCGPASNVQNQAHNSQDATSTGVS